MESRPERRTVESPFRLWWYGIGGVVLISLCIAGVSLDGTGWRTVNCSPVRSYSDESYRSQDLSEIQQVWTAASAFITHVHCRREFPPLGPNAYYFSPADVGGRYRLFDYYEGFLFDHAHLKIQIESGPLLLFCFDDMVINCEVASCVCPNNVGPPPPK
jgi:hypothetical protein